MTEGVAAPASAGTRVGIATWLRRSSALLMIVAVLLGLLSHALFTSLQVYDVSIGGQLSLINIVWLLVALVLCALILRARSSISRDVGNSTRRWLASLQNTEAPPLPTRDITPEKAPEQGAALAQGIFNLAVMLVVQAMLRQPAVGIVSAYASREWADGAWVTLIFLIALVMLHRLHSVGKPLAAYVVWLGLDQLVPTAGFAGRALPSAASVPTKAAPTAPAARRPAEATRAAGSAVAPAEATVPTAAGTSEATRLARPEEGASGLEATVLAPNGGRSPGDDIATIAETPTTSEETTALAAAQPRSADDATVVAPTPSAPTPSTDGPTLVAEPPPEAPAVDDRTVPRVSDAAKETQVIDTNAEGDHPSGDAAQPPPSPPASSTGEDQTLMRPDDARAGGNG